MLTFLEILWPLFPLFSLAFLRIRLGSWTGNPPKVIISPEEPGIMLLNVHEMFNKREATGIGFLSMLQIHTQRKERQKTKKEKQ